MLEELQPILPLSSVSDKTDAKSCEGLANLKGKIIIAGPCSVESREQIFETVVELGKTVRPHILRAGIWKPRTQPGCFEGLGAEALPWLKEAADSINVPAAVEVGNGRHALKAIEQGIRILWIGARTTVNPFAVQEIAEAVASADKDVAVLVKNPVNPDLDLWIGALKRLYDSGLRRLGAIHRGFSVYNSGPYRNRPIWQIPMELHRRIPHLPLFHDPSHTGGTSLLLRSLSQDALDRGFDGLMIESHCNPAGALSDGGQQVTPAQLKSLLDALEVKRLSEDSDFLADLRSKVDECDEELLSVLSRRMELCRKIGEYKHQNGLQIVQPARYSRLLSSLAERGQKVGLEPEFVKDFLELIHDESVRLQISSQKKSNK